MQRAYYSENVSRFLGQNPYEILGILAKNNTFALDDLQKYAWTEEIRVLNRALRNFGTGHILFEYTIPRIGHRIDNVLLCGGLIFLLEFKVGEKDYPQHAIDQVMDYALDLKNFHKESHNKKIVPILISTRAEDRNNLVQPFEDGIFNVLCCNEKNLETMIRIILQMVGNQGDDAANSWRRVSEVSDGYGRDAPIDPQVWINSQYMPTPTIIEAAQALYRDHNVDDISRSDAGAINLSETTKAINQIIDYSKHNQKKSICFITGVPGAGKTLAGLNIANLRHRFDENEHAVFLSGNQPLVDVLQEALARDESVRNGTTKSSALMKVKAFVQIIHHFRDDAISVQTAPIEKVAIFDEAQRAWDAPNLEDFMRRKKGVPDFAMSEPEFLISIMNRHKDWSVIICLIGGGQEINTGEAGLLEWFDALRNNYSDWNIYISNNITDSEYVKESTLGQMTKGLVCNIVPELHLAVSIRSFRSEKLSAFVKALLDVNIADAKMLYEEVHTDYPIFLTRDLDCAKTWIKSRARGTERYGLTASSGAKRLRQFGIWVQSKVEAKNWFLNDKDDVRSSFFLEDTATEFDIQGLELDWSIVGWDANLRFENSCFTYYSFKGSKWQHINRTIDREYLKNAYRVLLTRARQGMIIFIPQGDDKDYSRPCEYYDGVYEYLKSLGIEEV